MVNPTEGSSSYTGTSVTPSTVTTVTRSRCTSCSSASHNHAGVYSSQLQDHQHAAQAPGNLSVLLKSARML